MLKLRAISRPERPWAASATVEMQHYVEARERTARLSACGFVVKPEEMQRNGDSVALWHQWEC